MNAKLSFVDFLCINMLCSVHQSVCGNKTVCLTAG